VFFLTQQLPSVEKEATSPIFGGLQDQKGKARSRAPGCCGQAKKKPKRHAKENRRIVAWIEREEEPRTKSKKEWVR
jgi:hypothetical protein